MYQWWWGNDHCGCGDIPILARERNLAGYISPAEIFSRIDVRAEDIPRVILSHLHWDHSSDASLFPKATFSIQELEYHFWMRNPMADRPPLKSLTEESAKANLASLEGTNRLTLLRGSQEVLAGIECL